MAAILDPRPTGASGATTPTGVEPAVLRLVREAPPVPCDSPRPTLVAANSAERLVMRWVPVHHGDGSSALACRWVPASTR